MKDKKKLTLSVETLRFLNDADLSKVVGGENPPIINPPTTKPNPVCLESWEGTCTCQI